MGFLKDIFKRKPGGTVVGNLLRGAAKSVANVVVPGVGGMLVGNGAMMISEQDADKRDMSDEEYQAKYGVAKDGKPVTIVPQVLQTVGAVLAGGAPALANIQGPIQPTTNDVTANLIKGAEIGSQTIFQRYAPYFVGGIAGLILLLVLIFKKK